MSARDWQDDRKYDFTVPRCQRCASRRVVAATAGWNCQTCGFNWAATTAPAIAATATKLFLDNVEITGTFDIDPGWRPPPPPPVQMRVDYPNGEFVEFTCTDWSLDADGGATLTDVQVTGRGNRYDREGAD